MVAMKITRHQLKRIIREYAEALPGIAVPSWPERHFAWRDVAFTNDGDVRYINDIADPETVSAANSIGEPFPPGTNVIYIKGAFDPDGIPGQNGNAERVYVHDSELLQIIDAEGWHPRPPPEGAISGFWDARGIWSEDPDPDDRGWDLPPEDMEEPLVERKKIKITRRQLRKIVRETRDSYGRLDTHNMSANEAAELMAVLREFGYSLFIPPTADSNNTAIDDALTGYPGEFTYDDLITAINITQGRGA